MSSNICAIATAYGVGAISIIRCSGPDAFTLVNKVFKGRDLTKVKSHTINYGHIVDDGEIIDEVLCNVFIGPRSFDGENIVEINCHGGVYVTNRVLQTLLKAGFQMAEPGEFSKRAFLNHRLDLTQAEAIMDIISSDNKLALESSQNSLRKSTFNLVKTYRERLLDIIAKIEVNIDYPEYEDAVDVTQGYLLPIVDDLIKDMKVILDNSKISTIAIHGISAAIVGKPNVGKSSLLNMLLDEDKAIVSNIAGTTRDIVEGTLSIGNVTLRLIDTAGIHDSDDYIESIGIKKSEEAINKAELILLVLDSSSELTSEDKRLLDATKNKKRIVIANKCDKRSIDIPDALYISALNKEGLSLLAKRIEEVTRVNEFNNLNGNFLNNNRQVALMDKAYRSLISAKNSINMGNDVALIEIDIKDAFDALGCITGEANPEELITALFSKFCLGK